MADESIDIDIEEGFPGFYCTDCKQMFGKIKSFDAHWKRIDPSEPMFAELRWSNERAQEFEKRWPEDNRRCATQEEIESLGLHLDHRNVWITPEEEAVAKRLQAVRPN